VAVACTLALERHDVGDEVINVGSGTSVTVREIARRLAKILGRGVEPQLTGECRVGDIRHCFADVTKARELLSFEPAVRLEDGMRELAAWLEGQVANDLVDQARDELRSRGLTV
jgi:dTDP-L-rhamnose 4-epimerase